MFFHVAQPGQVPGSKLESASPNYACSGRSEVGLLGRQGTAAEPKPVCDAPSHHDKIPTLATHDVRPTTLMSSTRPVPTCSY